MLLNDLKRINVLNVVKKSLLSLLLAASIATSTIAETMS